MPTIIAVVSTELFGLISRIRRRLDVIWMRSRSNRQDGWARLSPLRQSQLELLIRLSSRRLSPLVDLYELELLNIQYAPTGWIVAACGNSVAHCNGAVRSPCGLSVPSSSAVDFEVHGDPTIHLHALFRNLAAVSAATWSGRGSGINAWSEFAASTCAATWHDGADHPDAPEGRKTSIRNRQVIRGQPGAMALVDRNISRLDMSGEELGIEQGRRRAVFGESGFDRA
jgi:hypothetical protein